jgi:hypothetical protein
MDRDPWPIAGNDNQDCYWYFLMETERFYDARLAT